MDFMKPSNEGYTIYSKSGCINCHKVEKLLTKEKSEIIDCDDYLLEDKEGFLSFIQEIAGKEWKTFPMVFYKGKFLGGFSETQKEYELQKAFQETDF